MSDFDFMKPPEPKPRVLPSPDRTPKQLHDAEIAWRNSWVNDIRSASYFWVALRGETVILQEYEPCNDLCSRMAEPDPTAHRHHLNELPGKWAPITIGEAVVFDENHNEVTVPVTIPGFKATEDFEPFILRAVPVTLSHQDLKPIEFTLSPGVELIWGHRTASNEEAGGDHRADCLVFGTTNEQTHVGNIVQMYADGSSTEHATLDDAYSGELHPALLPPKPPSPPASAADTPEG